VKIGFGTCRDPFFILMYVTFGEETHIVVLIEGVFDTFEERKLFNPTLTTRYFGSIVGMEVLRPLKDLFVDNVILMELKTMLCSYK
jgi:hypothetical protein